MIAIAVNPVSYVHNWMFVYLKSFFLSFLYVCFKDLYTVAPLQCCHLKGLLALSSSEWQKLFDTYKHLKSWKKNILYPTLAFPSVFWEYWKEFNASHKILKQSLKRPLQICSLLQPSVYQLIDPQAPEEPGFIKI